MSDRSVLERFLEERLIGWADFFGRIMNNAYGIGYPPTNTVYKILIGGGGTKNFAPRALPSNHDAEEVERWVNELYSYYPESAEAVRLKYFSDKYTSSIRLSKKLGISARVFERRVYNARIFLLGKLSENTRGRRDQEANIIFLTPNRKTG